jgi:hypothetical protein
MMRLESLLLAVVVMSLGNGTALAVEPPASSGSSEWPLLGRTAEMQHYSALEQINSSNVNHLGLKWFADADVPTKGGLLGNPLVANGVVYQSGAQGAIWAHDLRTGRSRMLFAAKGCEDWHGPNAHRQVGPDTVQDLRRASMHTHDEFAAIVIGGLRREKGMPVFAGQITPEELQALQSSILDEARNSYEKQPAEPSAGH